MTTPVTARPVTARIAAVLLAVAAAAWAPTAAHAATVTLSGGHVDVLDVDYTGGALSLDVADGSGTTVVDRAPADVDFLVPAAAKVTVPGGAAWSFLGTPGSTAWVLPQSQTAGLLFAGWNTSDVPTGAVQSNTLTFRLTGVTGPGSFSVYTTGAFGTPTKLFDSGDGLPDAFAVAANTHAHANWGFTAAGTYTVTFEVTARLAATGATVSTGAQTYSFTVVD